MGSRSTVQRIQLENISGIDGVTDLARPVPDSVAARFLITGLSKTLVRAVHTIKGSAGMFGLEKAGQFTHDLDTLMDACRGGLHTVEERAA